MKTKVVTPYLKSFGLCLYQFRDWHYSKLFYWSSNCMFRVFVIQEGEVFCCLKQLSILPSILPNFLVSGEKRFSTQLDSATYTFLGCDCTVCLCILLVFFYPKPFVWSPAHIGQILFFLTISELFHIFNVSLLRLLTICKQDPFIMSFQQWLCSL